MLSVTRIELYKVSGDFSVKFMPNDVGTCLLHIDLLKSLVQIEQEASTQFAQQNI